jgi:hypothetical protein
MYLEGGVRVGGEEGSRGRGKEKGGGNAVAGAAWRALKTER